MREGLNEKRLHISNEHIRHVLTLLKNHQIGVTVGVWRNKKSNLIIHLSAYPCTDCHLVVEHSQGSSFFTPYQYIDVDFI